MTDDAVARPARAVMQLAPGPVDLADLTARARIREAALQLFAEDGYERTTIRAIARAAGVSPGLLRHHYGSKAELRGACDDHVSAILRDVNARILDDPAASAGLRRSTDRYGRYVARSLADGSATAGVIFDELVTMTEQWLVRADRSRPDGAGIDRRVRAAVVTAMGLGIPLLHDHVSRALGADLFGPEGGQLLALALLDIYSHPLLDRGAAAAAREGFTSPSP